ncbi:MAG: DUF4337 domain-containing protein [Candidatus Competibacter denitrificans]
MPEMIEVDTDKLHEAIKEELEQEGSTLIKRIALTTALLAALAAVAALLAGSTINEALLLKNASTHLQAQASDQWAYYQAKGIKAAMQDTITAIWTATGQPVPASVVEQQQRYLKEQEEIKKEATQFEQKRDVKSAEADHLIHRHHAFARAVTLFQVAIALGAVAALTRMGKVWLLSIATGLVGLVLFLVPFI